MRVVVVDRSDAVRARLTAHLREGGFEKVIEAASLADARTLLEQHAPDVVVADIAHPGFRSVDVVTVLTAHAPRARLLILTNQVHAKALCLEHGAHAFFDKSSQLDQLMTELGRLRDAR